MCRDPHRERVQRRGARDRSPGAWSDQGSHPALSSLEEWAMPNYHKKNLTRSLAAGPAVCAIAPGTALAMPAIAGSGTGEECDGFIAGLRSFHRPERRFGCHRAGLRLVGLPRANTDRQPRGRRSEAGPPLGPGRRPGRGRPAAPAGPCGRSTRSRSLGRTRSPRRPVERRRRRHRHLDRPWGGRARAGRRHRLRGRPAPRDRPPGSARIRRSHPGDAAAGGVRDARPATETLRVTGPTRPTQLARS